MAERELDAGGRSAAGRSLGRWLAVGAASGGIAGSALGAIDGLWSWSSLGQFLPGTGHRLRLLLFLASSYALAAAVIAAGLALLGWVIVERSRIGDLVRHALAERTRRRDNPRGLVAGLSLAIAGAPVALAILGVTYSTAFRSLAHRKHPGLVIAAAFGIGVLSVVVATIAAFIAARPVEKLLQRLAAHPRPGRWLSSLAAPFVALGLWMAVGLGVAAFMARHTLALIPMRPYTVTLAGLALVAASIPAGQRLVASLGALRPRLRSAMPAVCVGIVLLIVLSAGGTESVRKAAMTYSGLGAPISRAIRALGDLDRDGYSRLLGGGDCDDWDSDVHPGVAEIPDDGIDNNCVGGDTTTRKNPSDVGMIELPPEIPRDANVLLITIDTVRSDHLGAYGYHRDTSPNLDALASEGALFINSWAHAPSTRYSIPASLTGRYPLHVHYREIPNQWPGLDESNTTIAEVLKGAGLTTGAILNYRYFDRRRLMDQGFDHYDNQNQRLHKMVGGEGPAKTSGSSSKEQTDKAIAYLEEHAGERFFLWVHYYDPHYDYEKHPGIPEFGTGKIDLYDHEIRFTDHHIGRLLDRVRSLGIYDKTIVVASGDHGEGFGEHNIDLHGYHLYAAQTRVPLIIRVPGAAPSVVRMPVGHIDILPTLANLVGQPAHEQMMGRSLVDVITGAADPNQDRWVFQQLSYEGNHELRAAASQKCHVIYNVSPETSWELYHIDEDPMETVDVIGASDRCSGARAALEAWYDWSEIPEGAMEALLAERPPVSDQTAVDFADFATLMAVEVPQSVRRGERFAATFTWAAHGKLVGGWKVFAHFEHTGGFRFMGDHEPPRPFSWWRDGQFIQYQQWVTVPAKAPPGRYQLWTGIFRKNERQPATSARAQVRDNRAQVTELTVMP